MLQKYLSTFQTEYRRSSLGQCKFRKLHHLSKRERKREKKKERKHCCNANHQRPAEEEMDQKYYYGVVIDSPLLLLLPLTTNIRDEKSNKTLTPNREKEEREEDRDKRSMKMLGCIGHLFLEFKTGSAAKRFRCRCHKSCPNKPKPILTTISPQYGTEHHIFFEQLWNTKTNESYSSSLSNPMNVQKSASEW